MRCTTAIIAATAGLASASPLTRRLTDFPKGTTWDIILESKNYKTADLVKAEGAVIDIDLFEHTKPGNSDIAELAKTKKVICYFSAGSRENWRDDASSFNSSDYGKAMEGWDGENWLDVKSTNVRAIMEKRIKFAAQSGCHAIDPDNVDGYGEDKQGKPHQDGYSYDKSVYAEYVNYLAKIAHDNNLAIGLKNALDIIPDVLPNIAFAVNEQCHEQQECDVYADMTKANKAVFNIEYGGSDCSQPDGVVLSEVIKPADQKISTLGGQCKK